MAKKLTGIQWSVSTHESHLSLPERPRYQPASSEWRDIMETLVRGNAVRIQYANETERKFLVRSSSLRAAKLGFKLDTRLGDGFISIMRKNGASDQ